MENKNRNLQPKNTLMQILFQLSKHLCMKEKNSMFVILIVIESLTLKNLDILIFYYDSVKLQYKKLDPILSCTEM